MSSTLSAGSSIQDIYASTVGDLQSASRGLYQGPQSSTEELLALAQRTDGLDTGALAEHVKRASGPSLSGYISGALEHAHDLLHGVLEGGIAGFLQELLNDFAHQDERADQLCVQAEDAADTIDSICQDTNTAIYEVLKLMQQSVKILVGFLGTLDPAIRSEEFYAAVRCAADLINEAGGCVKDSFHSRDEALGACFHQFLRCAERVSDHPAPQTPSALSAQDCAVANAATQVATSTASTMGGSTGLTTPTPPPGLSIPQIPSLPPLQCPPFTLPNAESFGGVLGAAGIGVAVAGAGALISHLENCLPMSVVPEIPEVPELCETPDEGEPNVGESGDLCPEKPETPKAPDPEPCAKTAGESSVDLDNVPEPPPPAGKIANMDNAAAPVTDLGSDSLASSPHTPTGEEGLSAASADREEQNTTSTTVDMPGEAHKAGEW
ncbi:hypothetical protein GP475_02665 [Corynebacterium poyangense]|uniref:Uncharacterized protein n=1 Tax=Corynebacterium poyangense TaxID=2684405 RepID=A0A7H0SM89_9CORY|nr:hypothetical protein [Corynebacterium poyangense]QNQ89664.1 hypothetical protein GP475_02665 [Corynebacterium poyangense]